MLLKSNFSISLPTSYICNQISKDVPIGTNAEDVLEFIRNQKNWEILKHCEECDEIRYSEGVVCDVSNSKSFYSLIEVVPDEHDIIDMPGVYYVAIKMGSTLGEPFWGKVTYVDFVFDENLNLINILVYKSAIGF